MAGSIYHGSVGLLTRLDGTLVNVLTVLLGTSFGLLLRGRLPPRFQKTIVQGVGLVTLYLGFDLASSLSQVKSGAIAGVILGLLALVLGGLLGEWLRIEEALEGLGEWVKAKVRGEGRFTEGFLVASLLFCVGPLTLIGSIENGLTGDAQLLYLKSTLDGLSSLALSSSLGLGVGFASLVVLLYQGGLALAAGSLASAIPHPASDPRVLLVSGVGGLLILGLGINLLELSRIRVSAYLPALLVAIVLYALAQLT
jgi:uncharacterized membrane protein YqgA involved in biofilm formation